MLSTFFFYSNLSCRFGYIEFDSEDSATKYYKSSKGGVDIGGFNVYVDYAKARDNSGGSRKFLPSIFKLYNNFKPFEK